MKAGTLVTAMLALLAAAASAQTTTGTIRGHVTDGQGLALPGVVVTATAATLQGERTAVTSETGDYLLTLLPSGSYTLAFQLTGFERSQITLTLAPMQDAPLDIALGAAGVSETIAVTGDADPLLATAQIATSFSQDLLSTLPTTRDLNAALLQSANVHPTGPNGAVSIAGATTFENLMMVNGTTITDNLRGTPFSLYIEDAIQETIVAVGGISAEYGRFSGGVVNVITRSGGNQFSGSFRATANNDRWRALTPWEQNAIAADPSHTDLRVDDAVPTYEYTLGGPVMKDRLWFFTAGRLQTQTSGKTLNVSRIPYTYTDKTRRFEGKGTYTFAGSHRLQAGFVRIHENEENYTFASSMDERSLGLRETPQDLVSFSYNGVLTPRLAIDARFSIRQLDLIGNGAKTTDPIQGTTIVDLTAGGRFWSDTFCGVCGPESRDNNDIYAKASYFLSTKRTGTHNLVFGVDSFDDARRADNHQSGSDLRLIATNIFVNGVLGAPGSGAGTTIVPQFLPGASMVQTSYIPVLSEGSHFRTNSLFANDTWRAHDRLTATIGVRWDKNHGVDQSGTLVTNAGRFSPRLGLTWDPTGANRWTVSANAARYVAAIANTIADRSSAAGNPQSFLYFYNGSAINQAGPSVGTEDAIRSVLEWFNQQDKTKLTLADNPSIPGVSPIVASNLKSPYAWEYSAGVGRQILSRASVRSDVSYRQYHDAYTSVIDTTTGHANTGYQTVDLAIVQNTDRYKRQYVALINQGTMRINATTEVGGQYTLSRTWGNFEGETVNAGPVAGTDFQYPEYKQESWAYPEGDLSIDQRHRARVWVTYGVPSLKGLTLSALQTIDSGVPYGAVGAVDPRGYVAKPASYINEPTASSTLYYFTGRDAFRAEGQRRTDFAANYVFDVKAVGTHRVQLFAQGQALNVFNQSQLCGCGGSVFVNGGTVTIGTIDTTVLTAATRNSGLQKFNPFADTPVEGVNWRKAATFGTARNRFGYTSPRQFRFSLGLRF